VVICLDITRCRVSVTDFVAPMVHATPTSVSRLSSVGFRRVLSFISARSMRALGRNVSLIRLMISALYTVSLKTSKRLCAVIPVAGERTLKVPSAYR